MSESVLKQALRSHPGKAAPAGLALSVHRLPADDPGCPLRLRYVLEGDPALLRWPGPLGPGEASRRDGLWRHTCFEAFVAAPPGEAGGYLEYNFAPSGAWACYRFDGYREGMRAEAGVTTPRIMVARTPGSTIVEVAAPYPAAGGLRAPRRMRLGLAAVLEAADGSLSYWALHHPSAQPDFHNEDGFQLEVEVPG